MDETRKSKLKTDLINHFGNGRVVSKTLPDGTYLLKISEVQLPSHCIPGRMDVLIVFQGGNDPPQILVKNQIKFDNGITARSTSNTAIDGEPWVNFSANFPWQQSDPFWYYVIGKLRRFEKVE
jgi:hypothetical protein